MIYNGNPLYLTDHGTVVWNVFREMLLAVWREACQHIEIHESVAGIAELLAAHVPLAHLAVERIDAGASSRSRPSPSARSSPVRRTSPTAANARRPR